MKKSTILLLSGLLFFSSTIAQDYLALVRQDDRWGYIDPSGEFAIQPTFEVAKSFSDGLARYRERDKWGYIDKTGKSVIHPSFERAEDFHDGMARVVQNGMWKYCDKEGKLVNLAGEMKIFDFSEGLARAFDHRAGRWGYLDKDGNWPIPPEYEKALDFSEGVAAVLQRDRWGYIGQDGKWVIEPKFEAAKEFSSELARVRFNGVWCFVDKKGKLIVIAGAEKVFDFSEGLAAVRKRDRMGFVGRNGKWVIEPQFNEIKPFYGGFARARQGKLWGFIDKEGKWKIQPKFNGLKDFSEGLALAKLGKRWGFIDMNGEFVIQPMYAINIALFGNEKGFHHGLARVKVQKQWTFINKKGEIINNQMFRNVEPFEPTTPERYASFESEYVAQNEPDPLTKPEPKYRGTGDPLKGLNVAKAKDMVVGDYYALIIGVDRYSGTWEPLSNAVNDAKTIEHLLRSEYKFDHFKTLYDENATRKNIIKEMEWLVSNTREIDNVFIYYSGHGEFKKELNKGYWVPFDATSLSTSEYISNNDLQTFLGGIRSKHTLLISDACFSGDVFRGKAVSVPFEDSDRYYREVHHLLSRQAITSGNIEPVMDGGRDGHSVFAYYVLKALINNDKKYFDASQLYDKIKIPVYNNSEQSPKFSPIKNTGDEGGQFIFIKK